MGRIGILAYGSLINDPGSEIEMATVTRIENVLTPFHVEFARRSKSRDNAPTLVPVEAGGNHVSAVVFVLNENISTVEASDILWRRETHKKDKTECYFPDETKTDQVWIKHLDRYFDLDIVLYTWIRADIDPLTPEKLAELAIKSAKADAGSRRKDGISYLIAARKAGIVTPLMPEYVKQILAKLNASDLDTAYYLARKNSEQGFRGQT